MADAWICDGDRFENPVVFWRVGEEFGGLSNMANDYPLLIAGVSVKSTEALYQACRYPHQPDWQREILDAPHAMRAKMAAKKHGRREHSREDWDEVRIAIMRWCLRLKLESHFGRMFNLLRRTGDRPIVERSRRDAFWGAVADANGDLVGRNQLGRLLMELRDEVVAWMAEPDDDAEWPATRPPAIANARLLGRPMDGGDLAA